VSASLVDHPLHAIVEESDRFLELAAAFAEEKNGSFDPLFYFGASKVFFQANWKEADEKELKGQ